MPRSAALVGLALSMLLSSLGTSIANVALPDLAQAFAAPFSQVQWVVLAYLLAVTSLIVGAGRLGDMAGRRRLLLGGLGLFTVASVVCGAAPSLGWLVAARAVQGAGAAAMMALTVAFVSQAVAKERVGSAMGLLGTMSAVGTALGPSLGGALVAWLGWRAVFFVNLPLGLTAAVLCWRCLPADGPVDRRERFDLSGTAVLAGALCAYAMAATAGHGRFGVVNGVWLGVAVVGVVLFAFVERRVAAPLVRLDLFGDRGLTGNLAGNLLVAMVMMATLVVGPFYLSRGLGLDAVQVGLVMSAGPVISALTGVVAGRLVDRIGAGAAVAAGLGVMIAGAAAMVVLRGVVGYLVAVGVLTPGYQLFQAANTTAVMSGSAAEQRGVVSGLLNLARNLGLVSGAAVMAAVFAAATGAGVEVASAEAVGVGLKVTFAVAAVLLFGALAGTAGGREGDSF